MDLIVTQAKFSKFRQLEKLLKDGREENIDLLIGFKIFNIQITQPGQRFILV